MSALRKLVTGALVAMGSQAVAEGYGGYETPPYEVIEQVGAAEIRAYEPHILALVTVSGERRQSLNRGFQVLAGYIFGGNEGRASVSMTAPVAQSQAIEMTAPVAQSGSDGLWTVTFMMPSEWTLESLPVPNSEAVRFEQVAPNRQVVLQFSGRADDAALAAREAELRAIAAEAGLRLQEPAQYYFYDDPLTLPWNRRNEVAFVIAQ